MTKMTRKQWKDRRMEKAAHYQGRAELLESQGNPIAAISERSAAQVQLDQAEEGPPKAEAKPKAEG